MNNFLLDFLALGAIVSGFLVITSKNPVVSVLFLISIFVNVAGYLVLLGVGFIGISYLIVYVGAVTVLFLFVVMMLNLQLTELNSVGTEYTQNLPLATLLGSLFVFEVFSFRPSYQVLSKSVNENSDVLHQIGIGAVNWFNSVSVGISNLKSSPEVLEIFSSATADIKFANFLQIQSIGNILYTTGSLWLLVVSVILLLAMVGPIRLSMSKKLIPFTYHTCEV